MANTLKFGAGEWATKKGSTLAYNDENGNFKPLPFTFDRSTSATRVNKEGLIEVVPNNEPRIDFLNDSKGALLLEPQRTNLITYSEDFTQWGRGGIPTVVLSSSLAPNGSLDAYEITDDAGVYEIVNSNSSSFDGTYTVSIFIKKTTGVLTHYAGLEILALGSYLLINTTNGNVNQTATNYSNIKTEDFGNWWRISATATNTGTGTLLSVWAALSSDGTSISSSAVGTNTFFGAQLEQGSYATSYIPTQGSVVTRVVDFAEQDLPNENILIDNNSTIYFEIDTTNLINNTPNTGGFNFKNSGGTAVLNFNYGYGRIYSNYYTGGTSAIIASAEVGRYKFAFPLTSGGYLYVNGVQKSATSRDWSSISISEIEILFGHSIIDFKLYNTALTDAELQALTS